MDIYELNRENIRYFSDYIGPDIAENIGREFYCGVVALDGFMLKGGMLWNYKNPRGQSVSVIEWFDLPDPEAAEALWDYYKEKIKEMDVIRSDIVVPADCAKEEKELLKEAGFKIRLYESDNVVVTLSELSAMPIMKDRKLPKGVTTLGEITARQYKEGISDCLAAGNRGLCEDLELLPTSFFAPEVSVCYIGKDGDTKGFLLFHELPSKVLSIQLMVCLDKEVGVVLPGMMRKFVTVMEENYSPDTKIILNRHNEASMLLAERLLPRGFGVPVYVGTREER